MLNQSVSKRGHGPCHSTSILAQELPLNMCVFGTNSLVSACFFAGKLLKAEYILSSLICNNGATGKCFTSLEQCVPQALPRS